MTITLTLTGVGGKERILAMWVTPVSAVAPILKLVRVQMQTRMRLLTALLTKLSYLITLLLK
jgi:hypothetical protein